MGSSLRTDTSWERWGDQRPSSGVLTGPEDDDVTRDDAFFRSNAVLPT